MNIYQCFLGIVGPDFAFMVEHTLGGMVIRVRKYRAENWRPKDRPFDFSERAPESKYEKFAWALTPGVLRTVERVLGGYVLRIRKANDVRVFRDYSARGLVMSGILGKLPGETIREVAQQLGLSKSKVGRVLKGSLSKRDLGIFRVTYVAKVMGYSRKRAAKLLAPMSYAEAKACQDFY